MIQEDEIKREEEFWDRVGTKWLRQNRSELLVRDPHSYLSGSSVAFDHLLSILGTVRDKVLLDYGCGSGWLSSFLALQGAQVKGFDISGRLVELAKERSIANGVSEKTEFRKMMAEKLDYPDNLFDHVIGISILHHISLDDGAQELKRVLKRDGSALFIEPLGENKFFDYIRNHVFRVHHGEVRTVDAEHPLTYAHIRAFGQGFSSTNYKEFQLLEMIARVTGDRLTRALGLRAVDSFLLKRFPVLRRNCRLVVIEFKK